MKILQILPSFSSDFGGPVRSALSVNTALTSSGHDVYAISIGDRSGRWNDVPGSRFRSFSMPFASEKVSTVSPGMLLWFLVRAREFDAVHIHMNRGLITLPLALLAMALRKNYVVQTHGMCSPWFGARGMIDRLVTWPILRRAHRVIVLSDDELAELGGAARIRNGVVVYNALPDFEFATQSGVPSPARTPLRVVFCGRLHKRKRVRLFVEVIGQLRAEGFPCSGIVAGNDEGERRDAEILSQELNAGVEFVGNLDHDETLRFIGSADVLLHMAPREPFGMVMIEAMALGIPVIAAESSGLADIFASYDAAVLVEDDDVSQWVNRVARVLLDGDVRRRRVVNAKVLVRDLFSIAGLGDRLESAVYCGFGIDGEC